MQGPRYDLSVWLDGGNGAHALDPHAVVAVVRLARPVSYDRAARGAVSTRASEGVAGRGSQDGVLLLDDDLVGVDVERSKASHVKTATLSLKRGHANPLVEVLPGDWVCVWLLPNATRYKAVRAAVAAGKRANRPADGLRLVGRVHDVRKRISMMNGVKDVDYTITAVGFSELDASLYYDVSIATNDVMQQSVGRWLARIGVDADAWFKRLSGENRKDNINVIIPQILELVLGKGVSKNLNPGAGVGLAAAAGAGAGEGAENAYTVPNVVGAWLGRPRPRGVLAYRDLLDLQQGIQHYRAGTNDLTLFVPEVKPLYGTFLPMFPQMVNTPFWSVLQQFLNPAINEMYTALRVNKDEEVVPTLVVRQIPFTTPAYAPPPGPKIETTPFASLPRWVVPSSLLLSGDVGRSDATRVNLVHVYGSASLFANNHGIAKQMVEAPPIRDDLDIQRSGPRLLQRTVECAVDDQRGPEAARWMSLVADWSMGSHLTLNGTFECAGLPGPIAEGDNVEIEGMIYHLEGLTDRYRLGEGGQKTWRTTLRLSNGVVADQEGTAVPPYYGISAGTGRALDTADPGESVTTADEPDGHHE